VGALAELGVDELVIVDSPRRMPCRVDEWVARLAARYM
jgi:hypothetical protein